MTEQLWRECPRCGGSGVVYSDDGRRGAPCSCRYGLVPVAAGAVLIDAAELAALRAERDDLKEKHATLKRMLRRTLTNRSGTVMADYGRVRDRRGRAACGEGDR